MARGYLHIYTGDGKGKTTAALGLTLRAAGAGKRVLFAQFLKCHTCSEHKALDRFKDCIEVRRFGNGEWIRGGFSGEQADLVKRGMAEIFDSIRASSYDLIVLDEAVTAVALGLVSVDALLNLVEARQPECEMVLTGRGAPQQLLDCADLVTEMVSIRHYFDSGVAAREGIEL
jgi:cob(I)alamin adenosyltransferase